MMRRPHCVEGRRVAIGRMVIQLVVHGVVDDASAIQAGQLVPEMLDAFRDLLWQQFPG